MYIMEWIEVKYAGCQGTQSGNKVRDGAEGQTSVFVDMYRRLTSGEIDTFGKLCEYIEKKKNTIDKNLLQEGFFLLKRLNWGAFANITKEKYPRLWKEMVIEDATLREYGELKRNIEISEIYVGVLDIHGYTLFCEKTKKNISMLHRLDGFINNQIVDIAAKYGALARRERGDEIILIGAEPDSTLAACYEIIRIFNKAKDFKSENDGIKSDFHLPPFEISAGIAGGAWTYAADYHRGRVTFGISHQLRREASKPRQHACAEENQSDC